MTTELDPWQSRWPELFRALADPDVIMPPPSNHDLEQACASWGALHHALRCLLGWNDVGRGLAWWYAAGQPVSDSPVLNVIRQTWGRDDLIDYYAAWAWKPQGAGGMLSQWADPSNTPSPAWLSEHSIWNDEDWWRSFLRRGAVHRHDPFYGGTDPLHLSIHGGDEIPAFPGAARLLADQAARRAVLVVEDLANWHSDLTHLGATLPSLGERSWRVDLFNRRVGWLGEFRRSRVSGRWFVGKHSIHMQGNAGP